jgi:hypothetical protein
VTVTCCIHDGRVSWFLTKESGQVPDCAEPEVCGCLEGHEGDSVQPTGYVIVKHSASWWWSTVQWSEVIVGQLCRESLLVVERRVVLLLAMLRSSPCVPVGVLASEEIATWVRLAGAVSALFDSGAFSSGFSCGCVITGVCDACRAVCGVRQRFESVFSYEGVFPYGNEHWWSGVTDGVDCVRGSVLWLRCAHSKSVYRGREQDHST